MEMNGTAILNETPDTAWLGWKRLSNGLGYVCARTEMPDVTGAMVTRWFNELRTTEQYKLWYPEEHVYFHTNRPENVVSNIGDTQIVHEKIGSDQIHKLKLKFRPASDLFDESALAASGVSAVILARGGPEKLPLWTGNVLHLVYDDAAGSSVMLSRFWMGDTQPAVPVLKTLIRKDMTSDAALSGLFEHNKEEMRILAEILPDLYGKAA